MIDRDRLHALCHCLLRMHEAECRGRWAEMETWRLAIACLTEGLERAA